MFKKILVVLVISLFCIGAATIAPPEAPPEEIYQAPVMDWENMSATYEGKDYSCAEGEELDCTDTHIFLRLNGIDKNIWIRPYHWTAGDSTDIAKRQVLSWVIFGDYSKRHDEESDMNYVLVDMDCDGDFEKKISTNSPVIFPECLINK